MREIKFRAWDLDAENRMYGWNEIKLHFSEHIEHERVVVMQYTGLKDKNGKEIYEGDIVSTDLSRPFLIVEYRNGAFMYQCHHNGQDYYDHMEPAFSDTVESTKYHKVIGNIYENPELIK